MKILLIAISAALAMGCQTEKAKRQAEFDVERKALEKQEREAYERYQKALRDLEELYKHAPTPPPGWSGQA